MEHVEQVGVIPRTLAQSLGMPSHGFAALEGPEQLVAIEREITFAPRPAAEEDPEHKQIIPYGVVCRDHQVFTVERLSGGGERRLHGKISIGIGGHINPLDEATAGDGLIRATLAREVREELVTGGSLQARAVGLINDDTQPVGRVHLGVVFVLSLASEGRAAVREVDALRGGFLAWPTLRPLRHRMETWSAFVLEAHEAGLLSS